MKRLVFWKTIQNKNGGFTLVELLVTMGLLSIFLIILANIFSATLDTQVQSESYSSVSENGRFIMARLSYDIEQATAIGTPSSLGATSSSLSMTVGGGTNTYTLNGTTLQLTDGTGTDNLSGNDVSISGLSFQRIGNTGGNDTVRVVFTVTSVATTHNGPNSQTFTLTAGER